MSALFIGSAAAALVAFAAGRWSAAKTRRDAFASAALQGLLADTRVDGAPIALANNAYRLADAMLAARSK